MRRTAKILGSVGGIGFFLVTHAVEISNFLGLFQLPTELKEALIVFASVPTLVTWVVLIIGLFCLGYLIRDSGHHTLALAAIKNRGARVESSHLIGIGLAAIVVGVLIGTLLIGVGLWQRSGAAATPIVTQFGFNTGPASEPEREGSPVAWTKKPVLGWQKQSDGSIQARTIEVDGKNIGNEEIQLEDVYIISGVTGKRLDMKIEAAQDRTSTAIMAVAKDTNPVPPGAYIKARTGELNGTQGVMEQDFLRDWGTIYFMAEYNGQKHRIVSDRSTIAFLFDQQRPQPIPPHVTLKEVAKDSAQSPTPREIRALYEGRTPLQAETLLAQYKGQRMKTQGQVLTILSDGQSGSVAVLDNNGDTLECRFGPQWVSNLSRFNKGDMLKVSGTIADHQNGQQVYLNNCEIN